MTKEKICGIYCIENLVNNKKYIGQSVDIYSRWYAHKSKLYGNKHENTHLQNSWNNYGEKYFHFYIVELCDKELLNEREIYWIKHYNTFYDGYNETFGGQGQSKPAIKVFQYTLDGDLIKEWNSVYEIQEELDFNENTIRNACNNKEHLSAYGYQWSYQKSDNIGEYNSVTQKKTVYQYDKQGNLVNIYDTILSVSEDGFSFGNVANCCRGIRKTSSGYVWSYTPLDKNEIANKLHNTYQNHSQISISKYSLEGDFIEYIDQRDYFSKNNYNIYDVIKCCNGEKDYYKKFQWRYGNNTNKIPNKILKCQIMGNANKRNPHKPRLSYRQKVMCINTNETFMSFSEAEKRYGLCHGALRNYFIKKSKYCGKLDSGERLTWKKIS